MHLLLFIAALGHPVTVQTITPQTHEQHFIEFCLKNIEQDSIPTSVKIAQAIIESDWGRSRLSKFNNFHGIKSFTKSHKVVYLSDEHLCAFRVFRPGESFKVHNRLLKKHYIKGDYRAWCKSLTWYATNPKYGQLLIQIIKQHKLQRHDRSN